MSTNIDDIPDPNANQQHPDNSHTVHENTLPAPILDKTFLQNKDLNSNIKSDISMYKETQEDNKPPKSKFSLMSGIFSEQNILLFCIIVIAGFPQLNDMLLRVLPSSFHNSIIVNIIKAILLFVIYIIIIKFVL
jgi:hypothetical protein